VRLLPGDLTGRELSTLLRRHFGYEVVRQSGSHLRLSTVVSGEDRITVPAGGPLRVGILAPILGDIAAHQGMTRAELEERLFA